MVKGDGVKGTHRAYALWIIVVAVDGEDGYADIVVRVFVVDRWKPGDFWLRDDM